MEKWLFWAALYAPLAGSAGVWGISLYGRAIPGNTWRNGRDGILWGCEGLTLLALCLLSLRGSAYTLPNACGWALSFSADGLRGAWAAATAALWLAVSLYCRGYLAHSGHKMRFYAFWLIAEFAAVGSCLAADLFTTSVFLPLLALAAAVLAAHWETAAARRAAASLLRYTVAGGVAVLMGTALLYRLLGGLRYTELLSRSVLCGDKPALYAALALSIAGLFALCGIFPLHHWLPRAVAQAPAPVAALLCAAIARAGMPALLASGAVFASIYQPAALVLLACGLLGMLWGMLRALREPELRTLLGWLASSAGAAALAAVMSAVLSGHPGGYAAAFSLLSLGYAFAALLLCSGWAEQLLHSHELRVLQGSGRKNPQLRAVFAAAALCLSGAPLFSGYAAGDYLSLALLQGARTARTAGGSGALFYGTLSVFWVWGVLAAALMLRLWLCLFCAPNADAALQEKYDASKAALPVLSRTALILTGALAACAGLVLCLAPEAVYMLTSGLYGIAAPAAFPFWSLGALLHSLLSLGLGAGLCLLVYRRTLWPRAAADANDAAACAQAALFGGTGAKPAGADKEVPSDAASDTSKTSAAH